MELLIGRWTDFENHLHRQINMVEMMRDANNYTRNFIRSMLISTPESDTVQPKKKKLAIDHNVIRKLEDDARILQRESRLVSENYGKNSLQLNTARGYVRKLLQNPKIAEYLKEHYTDTPPFKRNI